MIMKWIGAVIGLFIGLQILGCATAVDAAAVVGDACAQAGKVRSVDFTANGTDRQGDTTY